MTKVIRQPLVNHGKHLKQIDNPFLLFTLSHIMLKNGQKYFKNLAVFTPQILKVCLAIFNIFTKVLTFDNDYHSNIKQYLFFQTIKTNSIGTLNMLGEFLPLEESFKGKLFVSGMRLMQVFWQVCRSLGWLNVWSVYWSDPPPIHSVVPSDALSVCRSVSHSVVWQSHSLYYLEFVQAKFYKFPNTYECISKY